jgi:hypothetical protein
MKVLGGKERAARLTESPSTPLIGRGTHPKLTPMNSDMSAPRSPGLVQNGYPLVTYDKYPVNELK